MSEYPPQKILWDIGLLGRVCDADDTELFVIFLKFVFFLKHSVRSGELSLACPAVIPADVTL